MTGDEQPPPEDTSGPQAPHAPEAEVAVVGICLVNPAAVRLAAAVVHAGDFYSPRLGTVFATMVAMDDRGELVEPQAVAVELARTTMGLPVGTLLEMAAGAPSISNVVFYARTVAERSAQRRLISLAGDIVHDARALVDPGEVVDNATTALGGVLLPDESDLPANAMGADAWLARPRDDDAAPWVVPGLLREGHRAIFVSDSGAGKTWLTAQIAVAAAQGIHPFGFLRCMPITTLHVDAENPPDAIDERLRRLLGHARREAGAHYIENGCFLWSKMGGINLRGRADRAALEAVLRHHRPSLVVMGPLYKLFRKRPHEDHEDAALDVQNILDDLRVRYRFALVLEAHAPHGELRVRGSTAWGNWPEYGFGLRPTATGRFEVERFRGDRVKAYWPASFDRQPVGLWPWIGQWENNEWRNRMLDEAELWEHRTDRQGEF